MMFCLTHAPFYVDAVKRGYAEAFTAQYTNWFAMVRFLATQQLTKRAPSPPPPTQPTIASTTAEPPPPLPTQTATAKTTPEPPPPAPTKVKGDVDSDGYLQKRALSDVIEARTFYDRTFALATYLPILVALLIILPAVALLGVALARGDFALKTSALVLLVTDGFGLTLFPQYFFFRPDTPHLSEFMAPFVVAIACAIMDRISMAQAEHRCGHLLWSRSSSSVCSTWQFFSSMLFPRSHRGRSPLARCANISSSRRMASVSG